MIFILCLSGSNFKTIAVAYEPNFKTIDFAYACTKLRANVSAFDEPNPGTCLELESYIILAFYSGEAYW